jgi:hypothetical protein
MHVTKRGPAAVIASRDRAVRADTMLQISLGVRYLAVCGLMGGDLLRNVLLVPFDTAATTLLVETNKNKRFRALKASTCKCGGARVTHKQFLSRA